MPRVPPVTRAVIPVRDHLDFGLLLSSLAIFAISLSLLQLFELWKRFFGVKMLSTHTLSTDEFGKSGCSSSSDDEGECGPQKLTRAQRKRIRKKKVREAASRRRKLIGPVLPGDDDGSGDLSNESQGVVRNAAEKSDIGSAMPGERAGCTNQNKRKHRRMAKKQARERSVLSTSENFHQDCGPCSKNDRLT
ncbi:hypothetical protein RHGRI_029150 [Rhododendron griersonianum]|uniref:Uncharacterized protein n=1 Tax=Rhododendron griersonianum TaxID=479676 RepID=A0AAV6IP43_9ERIC|nr:hypothetical protein RHGRI_029150 [Rhododendron griersonianum]